MTKFKVSFEILLDSTNIPSYIEDYILSHLEGNERVDDFDYEIIEENVIPSENDE